jgi:hypothetical protein
VNRKNPTTVDRDVQPHQQIRVVLATILIAESSLLLRQESAGESRRSSERIPIQFAPQVDERAAEAVAL